MKKKPILRYLIIIDRDFIWKQEKPYHCHAHFCVNSLLSDAIKIRFEGTHYINHELKVKDRKTGRLLFEGNNYPDFLKFAEKYESQNMNVIEVSKQKITPLQALHKIANIEMKEQYKADKGGFVYRVVSDECPKELKIIETALKEKEQQDSVLKTLKEIIVLDKKLPDIKIDDNGNIQDVIGGVAIKIQRQMENKERELLRKWVLNQCFPKELKALEIIKVKRVDVHSFMLGMNINTYETFIKDGIKYGWFREELTKEEYELLKEILL